MTIKDRTIAERMRRYRAKLRASGFRRKEVTLPARAAGRLSFAVAARRLIDAEAALRRALATVNAPRPEALDRGRFLWALASPDERWRPHIEAFFNEVEPETIHAICLSGPIGFPFLAASLEAWKMRDAAHGEWIREMARERLAASP